MRKEKKFFGEAAVLLLAVVLILSTSAVMADTTENTLSDCGCAIPGLFEPNPLSFDEETLGFFDPGTTPTTCVGLTSEPPAPPYFWKSAIRITQDELAQYAGWNITGVNVYHCYGDVEDHFGDLIIYGEGTPSIPGSIITTEPYAFDNEGWFRVDLSNPVPIDDHNEIWVAVDWETQDPDHPGGMDGTPAVDGKGDFIYINSAWTETQTFGADFDHNWGMEAIIEGTGTTWTELSIAVPTGPIGVSTGINNIGENPAENVVYSLAVTGGILGRVNVSVPGTVATLAVGAEEEVSSGIFFGFGPIDIVIIASADNADEVTATFSGFLLGFLVIGIS